MKVSLIIACGGNSSRCPVEGGKIHYPWEGKILLYYTLLPFLIHPDLIEIIVALKTEDLPIIPSQIQALLECPPPGKNFPPIKWVEGGRSRQESVSRAFDAVGTSSTHVLIQDGARPFTSLDLVNRVLLGLERGNLAVIPGIPLSDTLKEVSPLLQTQLIKTHNRENYRLIQTPQGFLKSSYGEALLQFKGLNKSWGTYTDDSMFMEAMGIPVEVIPGDRENLKITYPEDFLLFEAFKGRILQNETHCFSRPC